METHVLRAAPTNKHWIGALKGQNSGWGWVDAQQFFWEDWEDGEGEEAADVAACGTLNHDSSHSLDGWTSEECESAVGGFICMKDTEFSVPEAAGLFKLFVTTPDGELAAAEEPPLWATVLWARSGYNSSVAAASGAFGCPCTGDCSARTSEPRHGASAQGGTQHSTTIGSKRCDGGGGGRGTSSC